MPNSRIRVKLKFEYERRGGTAPPSGKGNLRKLLRVAGYTGAVISCVAIVIQSATPCACTAIDLLLPLFGAG